jgi:AcrR family transcriptional regulator
MPPDRLRWADMTRDEADETPIPRALELLWRGPSPARRTGGLTRERIVAAAIDLADAEGLGALSMARLAERLGCGTMSLYRHVANKDELVVFMLSEAPTPPPPAPSDGSNWHDALSNWASGLWDVYHRHRWILQAAASGPPADPGQVAWLDAGLATLSGTPLAERDKLAAVMAVLFFVRGAAALSVETGTFDNTGYSDLLRRLVDPDRFPALATAVDAGVFDGSDDPLAEFRSGIAQLLDGIAARIGPPQN